MRKYFALLLPIFSVLFSGCVYEMINTNNNPEAFFQTEIGIKWPAPPSKPRLELVKILSSPSDFRKSVQVETKTSKFFKWLLGEEVEPFERFARPYAVYHKDNKIYVVDQGLFAVVVMDLKTGRAHYLQATAEDDILFYPTAVTVDDTGRVYVCDPEKNRIVIYDEKGYSLSVVGRDLGNWRPCGIAFSEKKRCFYVVDSMNHNVKIFDKDFGLIKTVGKRGDEKGEFNFPTHIFIDNQDNFYVTDSMNFRVQMFDANGRFLGKVGNMGKGDGHLERPKGVSVDSHGHIYVADSLQDGLQVFDKTDRFLMIVGEEGGMPGQFNLPSGVYCDEKNYIYVADTLNRRVQILKYIGESN